MKINNLKTRLVKLFKGPKEGRKTKQKLAAAVVTGGLLFSGTVAQSADLVLNGGFEVPNSGWTNQGGDYTHPYGGINGPQLTEVGTISTYGFFDNLSASAGTSFHGLAFPSTQTVSLVNSDLTAQDISNGEGRFEFSSWLATCCGDNPKVTATFDDSAGTTVSLNRGISDFQVTTADILVNPGGANNATSQGVDTDASRRYWALYETKGVIPTGATQVTFSVDDGRADAGIVSGNGNDNYADMIIFDAVQSTLALTLELEVNKTTGLLTIKNDSDFVNDINYYEIVSAGNSGTLSNGWNSLADQGIDSLGGDPEDNWQEGGGSDSNLLTEAFVLGSTNFAVGGDSETMTGGYIGGNGGAEDLVFRYGLSSGQLVTGVVSYVTGGAITGVYTADGFVGQGDLDLVLLNWGDTVPPAPVPAGWINDQPSGLIGQSNLDKVLLNWGNGVAPITTAVPEPTSIILVGLGLAGFVAIGRRK